MGIILPVGVANFLNTPAAITDIIGNQMPAIDVPNGTIYIAPDVPAIYTNDNGTWVQLSGGGGGGSSTGINGLNGTTNIGLGGTLFNTSFIDGAHYDFTIDALGKLTFDSESFVFTAATTIQIFDANINIVTLGIKDLSSTDEITLSFDRGDQSIYVTNNNIQDGLQLDFPNHIFKFGNYSNLNNHSKLIIDDSNGVQLLTIEGDNNAVLTISTSNGLTQLNKYGIGSFIDIPVYFLGVTANGTIIETTAPAGLTGAGVATRVAFWDSASSLSSNADLYWDDVNSQLGIGGTPANGAKLDVYGSNKYASFGTTAGNNEFGVIIGQAASSYIELCDSTGTRQLLINNGTGGFAPFTAYNSNTILFTYSNAVGGVDLPVNLTRFLSQFVYTTGTNEHNVILVQPEILTSGGTNLIRGIYYDPLITNNIGTTNVAIETTSGNIKFNGLEKFDVEGINGLQLFFNDTNETITTQLNGVFGGLYFNLSTNSYYIGNNELQLQIESDISILTYILTDNVGLSAIYIDYTQQTNYVGWTGATQNMSLNFQLNTGVVNGFYNFNPAGMQLDFANRIYCFGSPFEVSGIKVNEDDRLITIGDSFGNGNGNFIEVDDVLETIKLKTTNGIYNFANIQAYTDNADAIANGLSVGDIYRHSNGDIDQLNIVH